MKKIIKIKIKITKQKCLFDVSKIYDEDFLWMIEFSYVFYDKWQNIVWKFILIMSVDDYKDKIDLIDWLIWSKVFIKEENGLSLWTRYYIDIEWLRNYDFDLNLPIKNKLVIIGKSIISCIASHLMFVSIMIFPSLLLVLFFTHLIPSVTVLLYLYLALLLSHIVADYISIVRVNALSQNGSKKRSGLITIIHMTWFLMPSFIISLIIIFYFSKLNI